jgi:hypothetical protein
MGKRRDGSTPLILSEKDLLILRFLAKADLASAKAVTFALAEPGSLTAIRARLSLLAGGGDYVPHAVLLRVQVPSATGNPQRAYCLGAAGTDVLAREQGIKLSQRRPSKLRIISYGQMRHALALSAVYACLLRWERGQHGYVVRDCRLSYALSRRRLPVVPDLFCVVEGKAGLRARWIEVDASTQWQRAWTNRLRERLRFIRSAAYEAAFGTVKPLVCYVAVGVTREAGERRAQTLARWALAVCKDLGKEHLARQLRFTSMTLETVLEIGLWDKPVWFRADAPATPVALFPSSGRFTEGLVQ